MASEYYWEKRKVVHIANAAMDRKKDKTET